MVLVRRFPPFSARELPLTHVQANDLIFPQRIGPAPTLHSTRRIRYLLDHPNHVRGNREFVQAITSNPEYGLEFIERVNGTRAGVLAAVVMLATTVAPVVLCVLGLQDLEGASNVGGEFLAWSSVLRVG